MGNARFIFRFSATVATAIMLSFHSSAQTLINEDFETPNYSDGTVSPAFTGWSWIPQTVLQDSPGDGVPGSSGNQVIQIANVGEIGRFDTSHGWAGGETYVLTINSSPQAWSGQNTRYLQLRLHQTSGTELWASGNILLPKYDNFGGNAWGPRQSFSYVVHSDDFSAGSPGNALRLEIDSDGSRGLFFDNVTLDVTTLGTDTTAPTPNALTWESVPAIINNTNITMTCTFAVDDFPYGVQHYFENTNTGVNSGWLDGVDGWTWTEVGLAPGSTNSYRCKARDKSPNMNETAWSTVETVILPPPDILPPNPDPMTWAAPPMVVDSLNIYMVATTAVDAEYGVQYYFENVDTGSNSGWQSSPIWSEQFQEFATPLNYRVKARDISPQLNETGWSTNATVVIPRPEEGLLVDASFQQPNYASGLQNPFYVGWSWDLGSQVSVRNGGANGVPGPSTNKAIELNNQGPAPQATYVTDHPWDTKDVYTLTVNAAPNSWSGSNQRYLDATLLQTDDTVLWTTNVPVPLYTNSFEGAEPWPAELTFNFIFGASNFTSGVEGEVVKLMVTQTGARSLYIDNVHLIGRDPSPKGTLIILR